RCIYTLSLHDALPICKSCAGQGRVEKDRSLAVNIPAGVETGTRIRLTGEGEAGLRGGPAGDLYIFIEVADHALFQRENQHLFCQDRKSTRLNSSHVKI